MRSAHEEAESSKVTVDYLSLALPAKRFGLSATIGYDTRMPLLPEFALRLLRIAGALSASMISVYFGLSDREWDVLLDELLQAGLVDCEKDNVQLSRKGRALFVTGDDEDPRITVVEKFDQNVAFERATMSPLERVPYDVTPPRSVYKIAVKNKERAANATATIRESFKKNFAEIGSAYLSKKTRYERAYVYSVDDVIPKRAFVHEVELPVVLELGDIPSVRINFGVLERGKYGSRDELIQLVADAVNQALRTAASDWLQTLSMLRTIDSGVLSGALPAGGLQPSNVNDIARVVSSARSQADLTPLLGTLTNSDVARVLLAGTASVGQKSEDSAGVVYFVRPSMPFWGRSSRFDALMLDLRASWGDAVPTVLVAREDTTSSAEDLTHWYGMRSADQQLFSYGLQVKDDVVPGMMEIALRPSAWVFVTVYVPVVGSDLPVPLSYFSKDSEHITRVTRALAQRILPLSQKASILWRPSSSDAKAVYQLLDEPLRMPRE